MNWTCFSLQPLQSGGIVDEFIGAGEYVAETGEVLS